MADVDPIVDMYVTIGEDYAIQILWTDQYDEPLSVAHPIKMTVNMSPVRTYISSSEAPGANEYPYWDYNTSTGFLQLSLPNAHTQTMTAGVYQYDLWAEVLDPDDINNTSKRSELFGGSFVVENAVTTF